MPTLVLPLSGPEFQRATILAREAVTSIVYGGPAAEGALEFVLTESANNREVSAVLILVLAQMAASLAGLVAGLEDGLDDDDAIFGRTLAVVEEMTGAFINDPD